MQSALKAADDPYVPDQCYQTLSIMRLVNCSQVDRRPLPRAIEFHAKCRLATRRIADLQA